VSVSERIVEILRQHGIDFVALHPCAKIQSLYRLSKESFQSIGIAKEEEGVGICAGISLGGLKPAMLIQSTGLGNMVNALCSLTLTFQLPLLILASWRGVYQENIIAQRKLGEVLPGILESIGVKYHIVESNDDLSRIEEAVERVYKNSVPEVILLNPKLFQNEPTDSIDLEPGKAPIQSGQALNLPERKEGTLTRFQVLESIAPFLDRKLVVCNIGLPSRELYQVKHQSSNFYMLGSLGLASSIGLGVALTTRKEVVVIDGDGSLLSNLGTLATIAQTSPENLTIIAIDNSAHGSTGNQRTATSSLTDLAHISYGAGIKETYRAQNKTEIEHTLSKLDRGPNFVHILARAGNAQVPVIPLSPEKIKVGFMDQITKI
jgi:sulfopyruvate decarboxylase subunit beta